MQTTSYRYHVGIDLGTTHTVVAYAKKGQKHGIQLFQIEQLVAPGQVAARNLLPSVRYHPAGNELSPAELVFVQPDDAAVLGEAARILGAKSKGRLVTSAKSWLSHPSIDHDADILPWSSSDDVEKTSPIAASASYLAHIRTVWNQQHQDAPLEKQDLVITVPASFDEAARALTVEAARRAGLTYIRLLEEPQAVCYDWLRRHADTLSSALANTRLLFICDIGGGTTDLTLIKVDHTERQPQLTRIAVGDHIMLGGDNIDLALAHLAETRLQSDKGRLPAADFKQLIEQCRIVKERLLAADAPDQLSVTLLGGGSKLIGGSRSATLTREEVTQIALDGFFPLSNLSELPAKKRSGVVEFGLPYPAEPAISKHIAAFLGLHKEAAAEALQDSNPVPDALLLNGGVFRSKPVTERILALFNLWRGKPLTLLANDHPELSVAYGAVSYALAKRDKSLKIGGGASRSYFLVMDADSPSPATQPIRSGICLLPKGSPEGEEIILRERRFIFRTGIPVRFDLVSYSGDRVYKPGDIAELTDDFNALPPLIAAFETEKEIFKQENTVQLGVTQTELGTLKIQCIEVNGGQLNPPRRWNVEFQIRRTPEPQTNSVLDLPSQTYSALEEIRTIFGPRSKQVNPNAVRNLRNRLEKQLGLDRAQWDSALLRTLFAALWDGQKYRRRSESHERLWLSLTGYCLRPGYGSALDGWRVEQVWKLYPQGIQFTSEIQNWSEWWTLWRRIAGGLHSPAQEHIFSGIANFINPAAGRQANIAKLAKQRSLDDMIRLAAVLERLPVSQKVQLGQWLLKRTEKTAESKQIWWALGRVGARVPFYGGTHTAVPVENAVNWLELLLAQDWKTTPQAAFAAVLIARKSGDRARDIEDGLRSRIIEKLKNNKAPALWMEMVEHFQVLDSSTETQIVGEALPSGLQLINAG